MRRRGRRRRGRGFRGALGAGLRRAAPPAAAGAAARRSAARRARRRRAAAGSAAHRPPRRAPPRPAAPRLTPASRPQCEERCELLERRHAEEDAGDDGDWGARFAAALLPADAEWASARAALAPPPRRRRLLSALLSEDAPPAASLSAGALRYREQSACALAALAAAEHAAGPTARALLPLFPHNAYLALRE